MLTRPGLHAESEQRTQDIGCDVAVRQHRAFRSASRSGGIDDGRQIARKYGMRPSLNLGTQVVGSLESDLGHGHTLGGERREVSGEFDWVHHHDFFDLGLRKNRQYLLQLLIGRHENSAATRIFQHECCLFRGQGRVERNRYGAEQQAGHVGDWPFGSIFAENGDAITRSNAPGMQSARRPGYSLTEFPGRDR